MQLTANQTAAIFGLDPREIGGSATESLTYATDESRSLNRANNMRPYLVRFENMTARLLPERQFIRLNVDATIRTDIKTRTEVIGSKLADGRMSVDEARALEDEAPLPNGQGKFYNVPAPKAEPVLRFTAADGQEYAIMRGDVEDKDQLLEAAHKALGSRDDEPTPEEGDTP